MFLFGMTTPEVMNLQKQKYVPADYYRNNHIIRAVVDEINFSDKFKEIADSLLNSDPYMVLADFADYARVQQKASEVYRNPEQWNRMSLMNIAGAGIFAADRSIRDYANNIWNLKPVK